MLSLGPDDRNSMTTDLMKVPMIIMDWEKCSKLFPKLTKNMLCAGYENESYDACQVTKGSPHPHPVGPYPLRAADTRVSSLHWERTTRVRKMCGDQGLAMGTRTRIGECSLSGP